MIDFNTYIPKIGEIVVFKTFYDEIICRVKSKIYDDQNYYALTPLYFLQQAEFPGYELDKKGNIIADVFDIKRFDIIGIAELRQKLDNIINEVISYREANE